MVFIHSLILISASLAGRLNFKLLEHIEESRFKHRLKLWIFGVVSPVFLPHIP